MAKQRKTIGTGITKREIVVCDGEDMQAAWIESFSKWEVDRKKGGGDYGAACFHIIEQCHQIIANFGAGPHDETDSPADFAERIIRNHQIAQAAIKRGDADAAARFAYEVGVLATQAKMKRDWEAHALRGKKNLEAIQYGSSIANQQQHQWRVAYWKRCNARAALIWKKSPDLSKMSVAVMVKDRLSLKEKPDTIARNLKKPGTAR
jgi:hypothetical protein